MAHQSVAVRLHRSPAAHPPCVEDGAYAHHRDHEGHAGLQEHTDLIGQRPTRGDEDCPQDHDGGRVADAPGGAEVQGRADGSFPRDQRGDGHEVIGFEGVPQADEEAEGDSGQPRRPRGCGRWRDQPDGPGGGEDETRSGGRQRGRRPRASVGAGRAGVAVRDEMVHAVQERLLRRDVGASRGAGAPVFEGGQRLCEFEGLARRARQLVAAALAFPMDDPREPPAGWVVAEQAFEQHLDEVPRVVAAGDVGQLVGGQGAERVRGHLREQPRGNDHRRTPDPHAAGHLDRRRLFERDGRADAEHAAAVIECRLPFPLDRR